MVKKSDPVGLNQRRFTTVNLNIQIRTGRDRASLNEALFPTLRKLRKEEYNEIKLVDSKT